MTKLTRLALATVAGIALAAGGVAGGIAYADNRYPACRYEDGSGSELPCRWDCRTMGDKDCGPDGPTVLIYW